MVLASKPVLVLSVILGISLAAAYELPKISIQNDLMFMLPEKNASKNLYLDSEETYGNAGGIAVSITSGEGIFQKDIIARTAELGKGLRELNIRIPADQLERHLDLTAENAMVLAYFLQSLSLDPAFDTKAMVELIQDRDKLAEAISDAIPPEAGIEDPDGISGKLADILSTRSESDRSLSPYLTEFAGKTTDRRGRYKNIWVDEVVSVTENDTVWPEFSDKTPIYDAMKPYGLVPSTESDRYLDSLLENGALNSGKIMDFTGKVSETEGYSRGFMTELGRVLTPAAAAALEKTMESAPKQIRVGKLVPGDLSPSGLALFRNRLHSWTFFEKGLYSKDGKSLLVIVKSSPNLDQKNRELLLNGVKSEIKRVFGDGKYTVRLAGYSVVDEAVGRRMIEDVLRLFPIVVLVVVCFLFASFRSFAGVVYPLLTVMLAVLWCVGLMAFTGVPLSVVTTALPVILVAVGSAYGIHLVHYYSHQHGGKAGNHAGVADTLSSTGVGVLMAGLTTFAGFASLVFNDIVPLRDFGTFTSLGVLFSMGVSFFIIPSLLLKFGASPRENKTSKSGKVFERILSRILEPLTGFSKAHPVTVVVAAVLVILVSVLGFSKLHVEMNNITFFKKSSDIRTADAFINKNFSGTVDIRLVFSSRASNGVLEPEVLATLSEMARIIQERHPEVVKTISVNDFLRKMNQAFYFNAPYTYKVPGIEDLEGEQSVDALKGHLSSYLDKYRRSDMRPFIDTEKKNAVLMLQVNTGSSAVTSGILKTVDSLLAGPMGKTLEENGVSVTKTGTGALYLEAEHMIVKGQMASIAVSFIIVLVLVSFIMRSFMYGVLSVVPLFITLAVNFGLMGLLAIPLDAGTAISACVAIGIGIDYGLHYLNRYKIALKEGYGHEEAVEITSRATGGPIVINAFSVAAGFSVLLLSEFVPLENLGFLIALTMLVSSAGALTVLPAVLTLIQKKINKENAMKKTTAIATTLIGFLISLPAFAGEIGPYSREKADSDGRLIAEYVKNVNKPRQDMTTFAVMTLKSGDKVTDTRKVIAKQKTYGDLSRYLFRFTDSTKRGLTFMTLETKTSLDDQYIFTPAIGRSRQVASQDRQNNFEDTDLTNEDMGGIKLDDYTYKRGMDTEVEGKTCYKVTAQSKNPDARFPKRISLVDMKTFVPLQTKIYNRDNKLELVIAAGDVRFMDGINIPFKTVVKNMIENHTTVFEIARASVNKGVETKNFNKDDMGGTWKEKF
jgi:predicted RND superfamily exporter protein